MKKGYTVTYMCAIGWEDCLLVDNYKTDNEVWHMPINYSRIDCFIDKNSIGVWKIKQLKIK